MLTEGYNVRFLHLGGLASELGGVVEHRAGLRVEVGVAVVVHDMACEFRVVGGVTEELPVSHRSEAALVLH